jgi:DNA-directed RNA polymerase subunit H (RpoH/RPB5)
MMEMSLPEGGKRRSSSGDENEYDGEEDVADTTESDSETDDDPELELVDQEETDTVQSRFVANDEPDTWAEHKMSLPSPEGDHILQEPMLSGRCVMLKLLRNRGFDCNNVSDLIPVGDLAVRFKEVYIMYHWEKVGVELVRDVIHQQTTSKRRFMIIAPGLSATAHRLCQANGIEIFPPSMIRFDLMEHRLAPRVVEMVTRELVLTIVRDPHNLPTLPTTDVIALYHNLKDGQFVRIVDTLGVTKLRRVVC